MNLWGFEAKPVLPGSGWGLLMSDGVVGKIVVVTPDGVRVESPTDYEPKVDTIDGKITDDDVLRLRGGALQYIRGKAKTPEDPFFKALEEAGGQFTIEITETKGDETDKKKIPENAKQVLARAYKEEGKNLKDKEAALVKAARSMGINDELVSGDKASFASLQGKVEQEVKRIEGQAKGLTERARTLQIAKAGSGPQPMLVFDGSLTEQDINGAVDAAKARLTEPKQADYKRPRLVKNATGKWERKGTRPDDAGYQQAKAKYGADVKALDAFRQDALALLPKLGIASEYSGKVKGQLTGADALFDHRTSTLGDQAGLEGVNGGNGGRTSDSGDVPDGLVRAASGGGSSFYMHSASGGPGGGSEFGFGASTGFGGIDGGFGGYGAGVGFGDGIYSDFTGLGSTLLGQRVDNSITEKKLEAMIRRLTMGGRQIDYDSLSIVFHVATARMKMTVIKAGFELVKIMRSKLVDQEKNVKELKNLAGQPNLGPGAQADLARLNNESNQANNLVQLAMGMFKQNHAALEEMSNETNAIQRDIINHKREASRSA